MTTFILRLVCFEFHWRLLNCHLNRSEITVKRSAAYDSRTDSILDEGFHILVATPVEGIIHETGIFRHQLSADFGVSVVIAQLVLYDQRCRHLPINLLYLLGNIDILGILFEIVDIFRLDHVRVLVLHFGWS